MPRRRKMLLTSKPDMLEVSVDWQPLEHWLLTTRPPTVTVQQLFRMAHQLHCFSYGYQMNAYPANAIKEIRTWFGNFRKRYPHLVGIEGVDGIVELFYQSVPDPDPDGDDVASRVYKCQVDDPGEFYDRIMNEVKIKRLAKRKAAANVTVGFVRCGEALKARFTQAEWEEVQELIGAGGNGDGLDALMGDLPQPPIGPPQLDCRGG